MMVSMWLDRRLFGDRPLGFHAHSLPLRRLLRACDVGAVAVTRSVRGAVAGGAFFALSWLHAEVVAAVNYRGT
jgi:hypothetical protein